MRRLEQDERNEHAHLVALTPPQRLFVQRWIELFDRDAIPGVRCRPVSRATLTEEIESHHQKDYHVDLIKEELKVAHVTPLEKVDLTQVDAEPIATAERLALAVSELGFDHSFLYHAYKAMLHPPNVPLSGRLQKLRNWWLQNNSPRPITVFFPTTGAGVPPSTASGIALEGWTALPQPVCQLAGDTADCWARLGPYVNDHGKFLRFAVSSLDHSRAVALALESYSDYRSTALMAKKKPIAIDRAWALIDDSKQSPMPRYYAVPVRRLHFRLPPTYETYLADKVTVAFSSKDEKNLWNAYRKAVEDVRTDHPEDSLDDIAKGIDLAMSGYKPAPAENAWGLPRLFVEKASLLLALDWGRAHFHYVLEYMLKPSFTVSGGAMVPEERRPEAVFQVLSSNSQWLSTIVRCNWDELLKYRRDEILRDCAGLSKALEQRHRIGRWDLARAIRARNHLLHRGQPTQDQYLIAALLQAFDLIVRLRLVAHQHKVTFDGLVKLAEHDYENLRASHLAIDPRLFCSFGWRRWASKHGTDIT